jgi:integrase
LSRDLTSDSKCAGGCRLRDGHSAAVTRIAALEASARHRQAKGLMIVTAPSNGKREPVLLMPTEIEAIRAHMPMRDATLRSVLAYAGLRPGEALALQWQDVELGHIVVSKALSMPKSVETKTAKSRRVPVVLPLSSDLLQWRFAVGEASREAGLPRLRGQHLD